MVGVARLADKRRTGNTRGEKRQPHDPPRHRTTGQKIGPGIGTLAVAQPPPNYKYKAKDDNRAVEQINRNRIPASRFRIFLLMQRYVP